MESSSKKKKVEELTAAPREGCIEVRKMRMRVRLFEQHTPSGVAGTQDDGATLAEGGEVDVNARGDADVPGPDGWNNNAMVVRRLNTLLVSTRRGMGAIIFKFKSNQDCIEFCDRLVYLNRDYFKNATGENKGECYVDGMDSRESYCEELREAKKRRLSMIRDQQMAASSCGRGDNDSGQEPSVEELRHDRRNDEILSYMVRLSQDEDFKGFVDEIERGLQSSSEGAALGF
jgi:hypothetical protein